MEGEYRSFHALLQYIKMYAQCFSSLVVNIVHHGTRIRDLSTALCCFTMRFLVERGAGLSQTKRLLDIAPENCGNHLTITDTPARNFVSGAKKIVALQMLRTGWN